MLKVSVTGMRMRVRARYRVTGSVLNDSVMGAMLGAETTLEIDSPADPAQVARVVRNAERGCFVMQALLNPVPVSGQTVLNGQPLADPHQVVRVMDAWHKRVAVQALFGELSVAAAGETPAGAEIETETLASTESTQ